MVIIKNGHIESHIFKCNLCGCIFEARDNEVRIRNIPGVSDTLYSMECPYCKQKLILISTLDEDDTYVVNKNDRESNIKTNKQIIEESWEEFYKLSQQKENEDE